MFSSEQLLQMSKKGYEVEQKESKGSEILVLKNEARKILGFVCTKNKKEAEKQPK